MHCNALVANIEEQKLVGTEDLSNQKLFLFLKPDQRFLSDQFISFQPKNLLFRLETQETNRFNEKKTVIVRKSQRLTHC